MTSKTIPCAHCGKTFSDELARWTHTKAKHTGKKNPYPIEMRDRMNAKSLAGNRRNDDDDDESFADRAIAASIALASGEHTDDEWLVP